MSMQTRTCGIARLAQLYVDRYDAFDRGQSDVASIDESIRRAEEEEGADEAWASTREATDALEHLEALVPRRDRIRRFDMHERAVPFLGEVFGSAYTIRRRLRSGAYEMETDGAVDEEKLAVGWGKILTEISKGIGGVAVVPPLTLPKEKARLHKERVEFTAPPGALPARIPPLPRGAFNRALKSLKRFPAAQKALTDMYAAADAFAESSNGMTEIWWTLMKDHMGATDGELKRIAGLLEAMDAFPKTLTTPKHFIDARGASAVWMMGHLGKELERKTSEIIDRFSKAREKRGQRGVRLTVFSNVDVIAEQLFGQLFRYEPTEADAARFRRFATGHEDEVERLQKRDLDLLGKFYGDTLALQMSYMVEGGAATAQETRWMLDVFASTVERITASDAFPDLIGLEIANGGRWSLGRIVRMIFAIFTLSLYFAAFVGGNLTAVAAVSKEVENAQNGIPGPQHMYGSSVHDPANFQELSWITSIAQELQATTSVPIEVDEGFRMDVFNREVTRDIRQNLAALNDPQTGLHPIIKDEIADFGKAVASLRNETETLRGAVDGEARLRTSRDRLVETYDRWEMDGPSAGVVKRLQGAIFAKLALVDIRQNVANTMPGISAESIPYYAPDSLVVPDELGVIGGVTEVSTYVEPMVRKLAHDFFRDERSIRDFKADVQGNLDEVFQAVLPNGWKEDAEFRMLATNAAAAIVDFVSDIEPEFKRSGNDLQTTLLFAEDNLRMYGEKDAVLKGAEERGAAAVEAVDEFQREIPPVIDRAVQTANNVTTSKQAQRITQFVLGLSEPNDVTDPLLAPFYENLALRDSARSQLFYGAADATRGSRSTAATMKTAVEAGRVFLTDTMGWVAGSVTWVALGGPAIAAFFDALAVAVSEFEAYRNDAEYDGLWDALSIGMRGLYVWGTYKARLALYAACYRAVGITGAVTEAVLQNLSRREERIAEGLEFTLDSTSAWNKVLIHMGGAARRIGMYADGVANTITGAAPPSLKVRGFSSSWIVPLTGVAIMGTYGLGVLGGISNYMGVRLPSFTAGTLVSGVIFTALWGFPTFAQVTAGILSADSLVTRATPAIRFAYRLATQRQVLLTFATTYAFLATGPYLAHRAFFTAEPASGDTAPSNQKIALAATFRRRVGLTAANLAWTYAVHHYLVPEVIRWGRPRFFTDDAEDIWQLLRTGGAINDVFKAVSKRTPWEGEREAAWLLQEEHAQLRGVVRALTATVKGPLFDEKSTLSEFVDLPEYIAVQRLGEDEKQAFLTALKEAKTIQTGVTLQQAKDALASLRNLLANFRGTDVLKTLPSAEP